MNDLNRDESPKLAATNAVRVLVLLGLVVLVGALGRRVAVRWLPDFAMKTLYPWYRTWELESYFGASVLLVMALAAWVWAIDAARHDYRQYGREMFLQPTTLFAMTLSMVGLSAIVGGLVGAVHATLALVWHYEPEVLGAIVLTWVSAAGILGLFAMLMVDTLALLCAMLQGRRSPSPEGRHPEGRPHEPPKPKRVGKEA